MRTRSSWCCAGGGGTGVRWSGFRADLYCCHQWGPAEELSQLTLPAHRTMNPCPLYDANSGTVFLFCICVRRRVSEWHQIVVGRSAARLCCSSSPDGGLTWSPLRDLTHEAIASDLPYWATFAVGPGHGVQLDSGRLAVPAYAYYVHGRLCGVPLPCFTRPHSFVFYSDDGGRSWQKGSLLRGMRTGECQVAEIAAEDGGRLLYCSARRPCRCRAVAVSADRGQRFGLPARSPALCEPPQGCQGSVVSFVPSTIGCPVGTTKSPSGDTRRWLLCSDSTNQRLRCRSGNESPSRDTQRCLLCATSPESPSRDTQLCYHPTNLQQRCDLGLHVHTAPPSECPTGTASTESPNGDTQRRLLSSNPTNQLQQCDLGTESPSGDTQRRLLCSNPTNQLQQCDLGTESPSGDTQRRLLCSNPTNQLQQCDLGTESPSGDTQRQLLCSNPTNQLQQCDLGTESPSGDTQRRLLCSNPTNQLQQCDLGTESPNGDTQRQLFCSNPTNQLQQCDLGTESPSGDTQRWLLYSHPTNRRHRRDLGLYVNTAPPNEGGWRHPRVLQEGPCGYSDLAVCPDGVFGCLFECGEVSGCEEIAFCLFTLGTAGGGEGSERPCLGKEPIFGVLSPKSSGENSEEDVRDANPAVEKQRCKAFN
ncbi:sialidase-3 isoform X2 [Tympanuchus pallidicinctus]|uniref:sialidase-3 isoform X2 n=1 Tax=Tympanuchus pallidicinctus TaxID=109042 RepID=UPI0022872C3A|nr:sialidase-3 isoform X2 [Tympanuchus pallidicinctus]